MSEKRQEEYKFRARADRRQDRAEEGVQLRKEKRDEQVWCGLWSGERDFNSLSLSLR